MKIVLINVKEDFTPVPPMGILCVGTVLKKEGHDVFIFDIDINSKRGNLREIEKINPDMVGFTAMTTSYSITKEINKTLKSRLPFTYFFWGGVHASALPIDTMRENDLDFLVYGEGELTTSEVCKKITSKKETQSTGVDLGGIKGVYYYHNGKIRENPPQALVKDLDRLPIPDRSLIKNFRWYLNPPGLLRGEFYYGITMMHTSRGCPYKCIFCSSRIIHGSQIRRRSVQHVLEELAYLVNDFGVKGVWLSDDTFATDIEWLKEFCAQISSRFPKIIWGCQTRANIAQNYEILKMMKAAGCVQVDIGCESGSDKVLARLQKGITSKMILKSFENLKKLKMVTYATFILGNPGETLEDIKATDRVAKKAPGAVSFLTLVPYPGTSLFKMAVDKDWLIDKHLRFDERWTNKQSDTPVMAAGLKTKQLVEIRAKLQNKYIIRNNIPILLSFIKSPRYAYLLIISIAANPKFVLRSSLQAIKKKKVMDLLESLYQNFNAYLRKHT